MRIPRSRSCLFAGVLIAATTTMSSMASAQTSTERAAAQLLFDEARTLLKKGEIAKACDKLKESHRIEPAVGTLLNLASCYEKLGHTASAWLAYTEVASIANKAGQKKREIYARNKIEELKGALSFMRVEVTEPVDGMVITRGGDPVPQSLWGSPIPVNPGTHEIAVTAPGKKPWSGTVEVGEKGTTSDIAVPALEDAPPEPKPVAATPPTAPAPDEGPDAQFISGWVIGAIGLAGAGLGTAFRVMALEKDDESLAFCDPADVTQCDQQGVDLRDEARRLQTASVVGWAAGGALLATGIILIATSPTTLGDNDEAVTDARLSVLPLVGPNLTGIVATGSF